ncbi:MAG: lysylphosphatidylglycerol synthase transmembrane domain-containing protein, partial [Candidatus Methanoperedens sp.]|nr:lysylphosphatidylglycerol synthase transmembrane domain-containing protein [Candidatus Methanoperedens sp.]
IGNIVSLRDLFSSVVSGSKVKLLGAMALGIILLVGIFSFSGFSQVYDTIKSASLYYVLLGFVGVTASFVMRTWRWSVLLRTSGHVVPRDILFKSLMFGYLLNYFLPARAGDIARGAALKYTQRTPMGISLTTIVIERAIDMFTLAFLLGAGAMLLSSSGTVVTLAVVSLAIALLLVMLLLIFYKYGRFISEKLGKRIPLYIRFHKYYERGHRQVIF